MRKRFLERLRDGTGYRDEISQDEFIASVVRSLERILNSGRGQSPAEPNYGLPDFQEMARRMPDSIQDIKAAIRQAIKDYEPRLDHVQVLDDTDDESNRLRLIIKATARTEAGRGGRVSLCTSFARGGRIGVDEA